jgi:hypothetical protein
MTSGKVSDALLNWSARLATLPADKRAAATTTLLKLLQARAAAKEMLEPNTRFPFENEAVPAARARGD